MRRRVGIGVVLALAFAVPAAGAQNATQVLFGISGFGKAVSTTEVPAQLTGSLTVAFHGDRTAGCAAQGLCGYAGTVVLSPGSGADVGIERFRHRGHATYAAALSLGGGQFGAMTAARVQRSGGGLCGDATSPFVTVPATISRGVVTVPLLAPGGTLLTTRCAGPLDSDLSSASPQIQLPLGQLLRGRRTLDLSGTRSFAAGGFAGTVTSTLRLGLGRPSTQPSARNFRGVKTRREREVIETLAVTQARGALGLSIRSDPATCPFLDSCGVQGSVTGMIAAQNPTASLDVIGPATRPYADFLAALGLSQTGNPRGLQVVGAVTWGSGGTLASNLDQGVPCTSQAPLGGGTVQLFLRADRLAGSYVPLTSLRTRCPGPRLAQDETLATGSLSLRGAGNRRFTLRMSGQGPLSDDGYSFSQQTSLTLSLRRAGLRQVIQREPLS